MVDGRRQDEWSTKINTNERKIGWPRKALERDRKRNTFEIRFCDKVLKNVISSESTRRLIYEDEHYTIR